MDSSKKFAWWMANNRWRFSNPDFEWLKNFSMTLMWIHVPLSMWFCPTDILKLKFVWNKYPNRETGLIVSVELHPFLKSFIDNHKSVLTSVGLQKKAKQSLISYIFIGFQRFTKIHINTVDWRVITAFIYFTHKNTHVYFCELFRSIEQ